MAVGDEVRDPWGWLLAAVLGGLAWAMAGNVAAAIVVGLLVLGTKVAAGAAIDRSARPKVRARTGDALPRPPRGSPAAELLRRAEGARDRMAGLAQRPGDPWLRGEVTRMDEGADEVVTSMRDLAGRVTLAEELLASANGAQLVSDRESLAAQVQQAGDAAVAEERSRALAAVDEQLSGLQRLGGLRDQLLARMQTAAVGLETVATRMGEVVTLGSAAFQHDRASEAIAAAGNDLEALRGGLLEAQQWARGIGPG